jgi:hypothetical protein
MTFNQANLSYFAHFDFDEVIEVEFILSVPPSLVFVLYDMASGIEEGSW